MSKLTQSSVGINPFLAPGRRLVVDRTEETLDCLIGELVAGGILDVLETRERDASGSLPLAFSDKGKLAVESGEAPAAASSMECLGNLCVAASFD